jgi:hypothetical protein
MLPKRMYVTPRNNTEALIPVVVRHARTTRLIRASPGGGQVCLSLIFSEHPCPAPRPPDFLHYSHPSQHVPADRLQTPARC